MRIHIRPHPFVHIAIPVPQQTLAKYGGSTAHRLPVKNAVSHMKPQDARLPQGEADASEPGKSSHLICPDGHSPMLMTQSSAASPATVHHSVRQMRLRRTDSDPALPLKLGTRIRTPHPPFEVDGGRTNGMESEILSGHPNGENQCLPLSTPLPHCAILRISGYPARHGTFTETSRLSRDAAQDIASPPQCLDRTVVETVARPFHLL